MENFSSILPTRAFADIRPTAEAILGEFNFGGQGYGYYTAFFTVLLVAWLVQLSRQTNKIAVPLYKASKWKWIFDGETLIKDSYEKVSL